MKKKLILCVSVFFLSLLLFSCKSPDETQDISIKITLTDTLENQHDYIVYTLPSPLQVSSLIKILNIKYSEELIQNTKNLKNINGTSMQKALLLGVLLVDLGYITIFEENTSYHNYLLNIEKLTYELGLKETNTKKALKRYESSINKKDSLQKITYSFIKDIEENFQNHKDKRLPLLIISGMLIEGLYILCNTYNQHISGKLIDNVVKDNFNSILLQNKIYLDNIYALLKNHDKEYEIDELLETLNSLKESFSRLNISYVYDSQKNKLTKVSVNSNYMINFTAKINEIRKNIINSN